MNLLPLLLSIVAGVVVIVERLACLLLSLLVDSFRQLCQLTCRIATRLCYLFCVSASTLSTASTPTSRRRFSYRQIYVFISIRISQVGLNGWTHVDRHVWIIPWQILNSESGEGKN